MKKSASVSITALLFLMSPLTASADIIKCTFTEPFINTVYSMTQSSLTIEQIDKPKKVLRNISFQIKGPGHFELWDRHHNVVQVMELNGAGSDGMSDRVYPYEVNKNGQVGGCTSNFLHAH